MVNEVVPRDRLIPRAYQIADHIMTQPRTVRRLTTQIVRRPWKQRIVSDLDGGFGIQMFGHIAKKRAVHGEQHIRSTVDYVREGRKNNFDLTAAGAGGRGPGPKAGTRTAPAASRLRGLAGRLEIWRPVLAGSGEHVVPDLADRVIQDLPGRRRYAAGPPHEARRPRSAG